MVSGLLALHLTHKYTNIYQMPTITKSIVFKWKLDFADHYQWSTENKLYNLKTMREIKKTLNGYSIGFWIGKKFYTLDNLRKRLIKIEKIKCPF